MSARKVTVRSYHPDDEGLLFGIAKLVFGEQHGWDDVRAMATLETDTVFVAELAGEPAGYVAMLSEQQEVRIEQLVIHPAHEAEGIETQLLEWAEGFAISAGAHRLQVVVEADNTGAVGFYRSRGFVVRSSDVLELVLPQH
jgi:ribosomal protein S18 acetylase RimI-like enzyme